MRRFGVDFWLGIGRVREGNRGGRFGMFLFIGKVLKGMVRTVLLAVLLLAGVVGGAYYWYAQKQLQKTAAAAGVEGEYVVAYSVLTKAKAQVETSWPATLRATIKRSAAHNWIPTADGLVSRIYQWSPGERQWIEENAEGLPSAQRLKLEALILQPTNGGLIDALKSEDAVTREVAIRELTLRTEMDFGFRPDAPESERSQAVAQWENWWAQNKVGWTSKKLLDKASELFE